MNVKSCEKMKTLRPSIVPQPVTTPSPYTRRFSMPNPRARFTASWSNSTKEPSSRRATQRSRAVSLPAVVLRSNAPPWPRPRAPSPCALRSSSMRSAIVCTGLAWRLLGLSSPSVIGRSLADDRARRARSGSRASSSGGRTRRGARRRRCAASRRAARPPCAFRCASVASMSSTRIAMWCRPSPRFSMNFATVDSGVGRLEQLQVRVADRRASPRVTLSDRDRPRCGRARGRTAA